MRRFEGYQGRSRNNRTNYLGNNLKTSGNTGDYMQLIGNIAAAVGDSLQAYGQAVSIAEDEQQQIEQQQQQQQVEQLKQDKQNQQEQQLQNQMQQLQQQMDKTQDKQEEQMETLKELIQHLKEDKR